MPDADDTLLQLLEQPGDGATYPQAGAQAYVGVEALDLAGQVDLVLDHRAGVGHLLGFARAIGLGPSRD